MDLNTAAGIASILGLIVGGFGLTYSVMAWKRATAAERAAREASKSVRRGNAAEDLEALADRAREMLTCVDNNQMDAASLCGKDLVSGINLAKQRWREHFVTTSTDRLDKVSRDVEKVSIALSARGGDIPLDERENLLSFCHKILRILSEEAGKMLHDAEGG